MELPISKAFQSPFSFYIKKHSVFWHSTTNGEIPIGAWRKGTEHLKLLHIQHN